jgi:hypothetical protein
MHQCSCHTARQGLQTTLSSAQPNRGYGKREHQYGLAPNFPRGRSFQCSVHSNFSRVHLFTAHMSTDMSLDADIQAACADSMQQLLADECARRQRESKAIEAAREESLFEESRKQGAKRRREQDDEGNAAEFDSEATLQLICVLQMRNCNWRSSSQLRSIRRFSRLSNANQTLAALPSPLRKRPRKRFNL